MYTRQQLADLIERAYRKTDPKKENGPRIDPTLLYKHGIPFHWASSDLILVSSAGYREAKELKILK